MCISDMLLHHILAFEPAVTKTAGIKRAQSRLWELRSRLSVCGSHMFLHCTYVSEHCIAVGAGSREGSPVGTLRNATRVSFVNMILHLLVSREH